MAVQFQVNVKISAGVDFKHEFSLTNPDRSPMDITGCKFYGRVAKHPTSIDATKSTRDKVVPKMFPLTCSVIDGEGGIFCMSMVKARTSQLSEGKYVYDVVMTDRNGDTSSVVNGLAFVDPAFGGAILDGGSSEEQGTGVTLDGGGAAGY